MRGIDLMCSRTVENWGSMSQPGVGWHESTWAYNPNAHLAGTQGDANRAVHADIIALSE